MKQIKAFLFSASFRQFFSYLCVGGTAAVVEWVLFSLLSNGMRMHYIAATCIAFIFSTTVNLILGKVWTFRSSNRWEHREGREAVLVFIVSGIGLALNIGLMYLFVDIFGLNTQLLKIISKIAVTGIVFFWNFFIRKLAIYQ